MSHRFVFLKCVGSFRIGVLSNHVICFGSVYKYSIMSLILHTTCKEFNLDIRHKLPVANYKVKSKNKLRQ